MSVGEPGAVACDELRPERLRVLVVDDRVEDAERVAQTLGRVSPHPEWLWVDGLEGLDAALEESDWDLVVCGHPLERLDALSLLRAVHERSPDLPLLVASRAPSSHIIVEAMDAGACDCVPKDSPDRLAAAVRRELRWVEHRLVRRAEQEQRIAVLRADRLHFLTEMATAMAHVLHQPLVGIRGLAEHVLIALDRGWKMGPEKLREKLDTIVKQADRMVGTVQHVLTLARDGGRTGLRPVQVNDSVVAALDLMRTQLQSRKIVLETQISPGLPDVLANPLCLEEVVLYLLSNARDAIEDKRRDDPAAPGLIRVGTLTFEKEGRSLVAIRLEDRGTGMPAEVLERGFEPFFTTKPTDARTGLGLAICLSIVRWLGGDIEIESSPGEGTVVTVAIPAMPGSDRR